MTHLNNLAMVLAMEITLGILFVLAMLYFIKGIRTPHAYLDTSVPPETASSYQINPQLTHDLLKLAELLFTQTDAEELKTQLDLFQTNHDTFVEKYQTQYDFLDTREFASLPAEMIFIYYHINFRLSDW